MPRSSGNADTSLRPSPAPGRADRERHSGAGRFACTYQDRDLHLLPSSPPFLRPGPVSGAVPEPPESSGGLGTLPMLVVAARGRIWRVPWLPEGVERRLVPPVPVPTTYPGSKWELVGTREAKATTRRNAISFRHAPEHGRMDPARMPGFLGFGSAAGGATPRRPQQPGPEARLDFLYRIT